eukprot:scaffold21943_cov58-Phaeocystis_antarctica.AAC.1
MSDDDDESCVCCMSCPRTVRTRPCGHALYCELCTIRAVQASGLKCGVCRGAVLQVVVVPVNPAGDPPLLRSMQPYQTEPELEGSAFESVFLQAKIGSDDAEVAEAVTAALDRVSGQEEEEEEEEEEEDGDPWVENALFPIDAQGHATVPEGETELPARGRLLLLHVSHLDHPTCKPHPHRRRRLLQVRLPRADQPTCRPHQHWRPRLRPLHLPRADQPARWPH